MFKFLIVACCAVMISFAAQAFELGKNDAIIYCTKTNTVAANEMSNLLNRIFGKKYKVITLSKADLSRPGIYIGFIPPGWYT